MIGTVDDAVVFVAVVINDVVENVAVVDIVVVVCGVCVSVFVVELALFDLVAVVDVMKQLLIVLLFILGANLTNPHYGWCFNLSLGRCSTPQTY